MTTATAPSNQPSSETSADAPTISPEQVRAIAAKVYELWLQDLRLERERLGQRRSIRINGHRR